MKQQNRIKRTTGQDFYYAPSDRHIRLAAEFGIPNVVIDSRGHGQDHLPGLQDDQLCLMPRHPQIFRTRQAHRLTIETEIRAVRHRMDLAIRLGLKPYLHSYELSMPAEMRKVYADWFVPQTTESRACDPTCASDRYLCLSDERVRNLVTDKIEEVTGALPGLAGYIYSFHESQLTTYSHFCDQCKKLGRVRLLQWLYEAVSAGARRVNPEIRVIPRLWGITHPKQMSYENMKIIVDLTDSDPESWYYRRLPALKRWQYRPEPANQRFARYAQTKNFPVMMKATWGDYSLNQPLNPWARKYAPTRRIIELSLEHCITGRYIPLIIGRQHQAMIRSLAAKNVSFCIVPVNWGRVCKGSRLHEDAADPARWGLNAINLYLLPRLLREPNLPLTGVIRDVVRGLYGELISERLARCLATTADVWDGAVNVNGVSTIMNLDYLLCPANYIFKQALENHLWYRAMRPNGRQLVSPLTLSWKRVLEEKDRAIQHAYRLSQEVEQEAKKLSGRRLRTDVISFFADFRDLLEFVAVARKRWWMEYHCLAARRVSWKIIKCLDELVEAEKRLVARSALVRGVYDGRFAGASSTQPARKGLRKRKRS